MRLVILLVTLLQVALAKYLEEVSGYLGENVTLPSGVNPSWNLSRIEWTVFSNSSWIATYRNDVVNVERAPQFKGRLSLNITSGDLTIHQLSQNDDMEYKVVLESIKGQNNENKIKLIVKKYLQKPKIQTQLWFPSTSTTGGCWVEARCSSPDKDVTFQWQINPALVTGMMNSDLALAFVNNTHTSVKITCISSSKTETASSFVTINWEDCKPKPPPSPPPQLQSRSRHALMFFAGVLSGVLVTIIMTKLWSKNKICTGNSQRKTVCTKVTVLDSQSDQEDKAKMNI